MVEKEADKKEDSACYEEDRVDDGYDEYEEEQIYVIEKLILSPKHEVETQ